MSTESVNMETLVRRTCIAGAVAIVALGALFFGPAGTFAYWQAWVYMAIVFIPMSLVAVYMLRNSPQLLERRLRARERERTQQGVLSLGIFFLLAAFLLPGFDRRWGWSAMPWWVVVLADLLVLTGYGIIFLVFRENQYTSRTVQVDEGQQVISTGPYAVVRHPMYVGVSVFYLASPIALGSWWAFLPAAVILPILIVRILNEEEVLDRDLPGYREYKQKVRYRVLPGIW